MNIRSIALAMFAALAFATAGPAEATPTTYDFSFTGSDTGSGKFTTDGIDHGGWTLVTGITGMVDGDTITGLDPYAAADQHLYFASPYLDLSGISFATAISQAMNLYYSAGQMLLKYTDDMVGYPENGKSIVLNVSPAPEPMTLALLGAGLAGLGFARRRKNGNADYAMSPAFG